MKPFAFLAATPAYARENNCGQYNGYIVFDRADADAYLYCRDGWGDDNYRVGSSEELTLTHPTSGAKLLDGWKEKIFITEVPDEARTTDVVIFGFDTCHLGDTWDECDFEAVKARTLVWLDETNKELEANKEAAKLHDVKIVVGEYDGIYRFCVVELERIGAPTGWFTLSGVPDDEGKAFVRGEYKGLRVEKIIDAEDCFDWRAGVFAMLAECDQYACVARVISIFG